MFTIPCGATRLKEYPSGEPGVIMWHCWDDGRIMMAMIG